MKRRIFSFLLALAMVLSVLPVPAMAAQACTNHPAHDENCGYGKDCTHQCDESCQVKVDSCPHTCGTECEAGCTRVHDANCTTVSCSHVHDDSCGVCTHSCNVCNPPEVSVALDRETLELTVGLTSGLRCTVTGVESGYSLNWSVNPEGAAVVSVDSDGNVTALGVGSATVIVSLVINETAYTDECAVTVTEAAPPPAATGIAIDNPPQTIPMGGGCGLSVVTTPEGAVLPDLIWTSSDETVATVSDGDVRAQALGTVTIRAESKDNPEIYAECTIEVVPDYVAQVEGTKYESLQEAIDACPEEGTVKLLKFFTSKNPVTAVIDKDITLDTGTFALALSKDSEISDGTILCGENGSLYNFGAITGGTFTGRKFYNCGAVSGGDFTGFTSNFVNAKFQDTGETGTVTGGTFFMMQNASEGKISGNCTVTDTLTNYGTVEGGHFKNVIGELGSVITGGTFTGEVGGSGTITGGYFTEKPAGQIPETHMLADSDDPAYTFMVVLKPNANYVAEVDGKQYNTLQEAIDACPEGGTVKLLADIGVDPANRPDITVTKNITLDCNTHDLYTSTNSLISAGQVKNGWVLNGGTISGGVFGGIENHGLITGGIFEMGAINWGTISGGCFDGEVLCNADGESEPGVITGGYFGKITVGSGKGVADHYGEVTSDKEGYIKIGQLAHTYLWTAAENVLNGKCNACEETLTVTVTAPADLICNGQPKTATVTASENWPEDLAKPTVVYTRGGEATTDLTGEGEITASITMGEAPDLVTASVTYTLTSAEIPSYVAEVGGKTYDTLQEAIKNCPADGVVTLLDDVQEVITLEKNISIRCGGYTLTLDKGSEVSNGYFLNGTVVNYGTIRGGIFTTEVKNHGTISFGSFSGDVYCIGASSRITGGYFNDIFSESEEIGVVEPYYTTESDKTNYHLMVVHHHIYQYVDSSKYINQIDVGCKVEGCDETFGYLRIVAKEKAGTNGNLAAYLYFSENWPKDFEKPKAEDIQHTPAKGKTEMAAASLTLGNVKAEVKRWIVTFDSKGGKAVDSVAVKNGTKFSDLPESTRDNYKFKGWYEEVKSKAADDVVNGNLTLSAKWAEVFTLIYDDNTSAKVEKMPDPNPEIQENSNEFRAPYTKPTRKGYSFSSWNTKADGSGTKVKAGGKFTMPENEDNTVTLYAQWKEVDPTNARTGDYIMIAVGVLALSGLALAGLILYSKKKKK